MCSFFVVHIVHTTLLGAYYYLYVSALNCILDYYHDHLLVSIDKFCHIKESCRPAIK